MRRGGRVEGHAFVEPRVQSDPLKRVPWHHRTLVDGINDFRVELFRKHFPFAFQCAHCWKRSIIEAILEAILWHFRHFEHLAIWHLGILAF